MTEQLATGKTYFLYCRISKVGEYDSSLDYQEELLIKKFEELRVQNPLTKMEIVKEEESGSKSGKRPKFDKMLKALEEDSKLDDDKQLYGGVMVFKLDRLARNSKDFVRIEGLLDKGYKIISYTETIENTPTGRLLFRMLCSFAIFESEKLSSRMSLTYISNLIKGDFNKLGGEVGYGYERIETGTGSSKKKNLQINTKQAQVISTIYELKANSTLEHKDIQDVVKRVHNVDVDTKQIEKIIYNSKLISDGDSSSMSIKYNGLFVRRVSINDEILQDFINKKRELEIEHVEFQGSSEIDGEVCIIVSIPELAIVGTSRYECVRHKIRDYTTTRAKDYLFSGHIFYIKNNKEVARLGNKPTQGFNYYGVRGDDFTTGFKVSQISEKMLEGVLVKSKGFKKIQDILVNNKIRRGEAKGAVDIVQEVVRMYNTKLIHTRKRYEGLVSYYGNVLDKLKADVIESSTDEIADQIKQYSVILMEAKESLRLMNEKSKLLGSITKESIERLATSSKVPYVQRETLYKSLFIDRIVVDFKTKKGTISYKPLRKLGADTFSF